MKFIALDLGANMAFAHNGFDDVIVCEHREFKGHRVIRAHAISQWLARRFSEIIKTCGPFDACVYERPFARGFDATRCLWGVAGIIEDNATGHGMAVLDLTPNQIKKYITGKGNGKKPDMMKAAIARGYTGDNEHEADAFCLLKLAIETGEKK